MEWGEYKCWNVGYSERVTQHTKMCTAVLSILLCYNERQIEKKDMQHVFQTVFSFSIVLFKGIF
jgi:hypothetical protein